MRVTFFAYRICLQAGRKLLWLMAKDMLYLKQIGTRWYARIPVPSGLRKAFRGPYKQQSLGTSDLSEARKRRWAVYEWAHALYAAEEAKRRPGGLTDGELSYEGFRAKLRGDIGPAVVVNALDGEEIENPQLEAIAERLQAEGVLVKHPEIGEALRDHIMGEERVSETLANYLEKNPKGNPTTVRNYETTVAVWIKKHRDRPIRGVTRAQALEWLEEVAEGKARDTVKRYATVMAHLWAWTHRAEEDPPRNPFEGLLKAIGGKGRAVQSYGFYDDDELQRAYRAVEADDELRSTFLMSLYTGFRLDECLRAERQTLFGVECFVLKNGKTENAARVVPVHPRLQEVKVPAGAKASALSMRYSRTMRAIGMPPGKTFHSLRKAFTTALERAGCPEAIAARLVGHAPLGLTYRVYSQGRAAAELREWVERVRLPV